MRIIESEIVLRKIRLYAYHGVDPQEQKTGAYFTVTLHAHTDLLPSVESDELEKTVSYADILEVVRNEMAIPSKLLEHVAGRIIKQLFANFPQITQIKLKLMKDNPPMSAQCKGAGVVLIAQP